MVLTEKRVEEDSLVSLVARREHLDPTATAYARANAIKASPRKLGIVANAVKGMRVEQALLQLQFCKRKVAKDIRTVLTAAMANAENNKMLNIDKLFISEILVGKAFVLKRGMACSKGRSHPIKKPYSKLTIFVTEMK
ncbi:MAG: 50S ribosomal protein L22 [Proteobacteria bacterium]|nr:50S ribosomal protein L22 [Pseudomonadota bacterium]